MSRKKTGARIAKARIADFESAISNLEREVATAKRERPVADNGLRLSTLSETSGRKVRSRHGSVGGFKRDSARTPFVAFDGGILPDDRNAYREPPRGGFRDVRGVREVTLPDGTKATERFFAPKTRELLAGTDANAKAWGAPR